MAATTATTSSDFKGNKEVSKQEIQAAIARAVELRAIHAALIQGSASSSPPPPLPQLPAHDYPIFTPNYENEPLSGFRQLQLESKALSEAWEDQYALVGDNANSLTQSDHLTEKGSSRKNLPLVLATLDSISQSYLADHDTRSVTSSCATNQITVLQPSPAAELLKPSRISLSNKYSDQPHPKSKNIIFSWLLPRSKKKPKCDTSSSLGLESEDASQTLKKALLEANHKRDMALAEVAEMRSSFGDLRKKLDSLEGYCEELKKALREKKQEKAQLMPVTEETMLEGFLQIVSEARLSVKHFCKNLVRQIDETDDQLTKNLNALLQPYKLNLSSSKCSSKAVLYHLEAIVNQALYQDFENCAFMKNGTPKLLDPQQDRQAQFSLFVALRNLSWNEVVRKGTKHYSEEFSAFCDHKMSCIISGLNWIRPWPEQLLQSFFVAAKCIRLLHFLAFSFCPALTILRVEDNRQFDSHYMEDIPIDRQRTQQGVSRVKIMVMPGFYVQDKILKCKVLCRYKSLA